MSSIPEEIYIDILSRVPVKSTFVCKCVCKSWFSIICDPDFVKLHLSRTTLTKNYRLTLESEDRYSFYSASYDSLSSDDASVVKLDFPCKSKNVRQNITLLGSCDGLVYGRNYQSKLFFLWNPATKEYKILPESDIDVYRRLYYRYHGFGYDYKTDDYKLVTVSVSSNKENSSTAVYSLKTNKWKTFQCIGYEIHSQVSGVLFNGALHWLCVIGKTSRITFMVSMDISKERFEKLPLRMVTPKTDISNLGVLEECLCLLVRTENTFEVWVMQDYGVPESWTKLHTIKHESVMSMCEFSFHMQLVGSSENGEIMFKTLDTVILYDPKRGTARIPKIGGLMVGGGVSYVESLVSLNSSTAKKEGK